MNNKFLISIKESLLKAGLSSASEISNSSQPSGFGDTDSIWELGNLRIKFIKDRGQVFVDLGSKFNESHYFIFDDVSLLLKWQELDEIINADAPLDLATSLSLIKKDLNKLDTLFSKNELQKTTNEIDLIAKKKARIRFG